jgi:aminotransferase
MPTDVSNKTGVFTESVIREMTRRALQRNAVNLAQGFPDFAAPAELKETAKRAIDEEYNQYAITHGSPDFRNAIARKARTYNGLECDPDRNVTVTCGATEAMIASMLAVINPGDEVIIFEPFYENYGPDTVLAGAEPRYVALRDPDYAIDRAELEAAFSPRTKAIIVNTPHNPTGKVFGRRARVDRVALPALRHPRDHRRNLRATKSTSTSSTGAPATFPSVACPGWPTGPSRSAGFPRLIRSRDGAWRMRSRASG